MINESGGEQRMELRCLDMNCCAIIVLSQPFRVEVGDVAIEMEKGATCFPTFPEGTFCIITNGSFEYHIQVSTGVWIPCNGTFLITDYGVYTRIVESQKHKSELMRYTVEGPLINGLRNDGKLNVRIGGTSRSVPPMRYYYYKIVGLYDQLPVIKPLFEGLPNVGETLRKVVDYYKKCKGEI